MVAWPQAPRGHRQLVGRGSNPGQSGMLTVMERIGENARSPRRTTPAVAAAVDHVFNAQGPDVAGRGLSGPSLVSKSGRLVEASAAVGVPLDVDLYLDLYRRPVGSSTWELLETFTLLAGADIDRWGRDLLVRNGDRLASEFRTLIPATTGADLVFKAITQ